MKKFSNNEPYGLKPKSIKKSQQSINKTRSRRKSLSSSSFYSTTSQKSSTPRSLPSGKNSGSIPPTPPAHCSTPRGPPPRGPPPRGPRPHTDHPTIDSTISSQTPGGWNSMIENNIVAIGEKALGLRWMHNESIKRFYKTYNQLNNLLRILTSIITGLTAVSFLYDNEYYVLTIKLMVGLLSIITIYLTTTLKSEDYPNEISKHKLSTYYYSNIYENINKELSYYRKDRKDAKTFYDYINAEFNKLKITSPDLDEGVMARFEEKYGTTSISKPWELYHIGVNNVHKNHHRNRRVHEDHNEYSYSSEHDDNPISQWRNNMMSRVAEEPPDSEDTEDLPLEVQQRRRANTNDPNIMYQIDRFMTMN